LKTNTSCTFTQLKAATEELLTFTKELSIFKTFAGLSESRLGSSELETAGVMRVAGIIYDCSESMTLVYALIVFCKLQFPLIKDDDSIILL